MYDATIIGLGYQARVGKDTVADYLVKEYGFTKIAFAGSLKEAAHVIFGLTPEQLYGDMKEMIDPFWDDTPRNILQLMGYDCMRKGYRDDVWVKALFRRLSKGGDVHGKDVVITDCRFPNEANAVLDAKGYLWNITRENRPRITNSSHVSEQAMADYSDWDAEIANNGGLIDLYREVDDLMNELPKFGVGL